MSDESFDRARRDYESRIARRPAQDEEQIQFDKTDWLADTEHDDN